jgi:cytidylate kinase
VTETKAPVITFDGPSGVGKGTLSALVSEKLGWHYLDSGALYRILGYAAEQSQVSFDDDEGLVNLLRDLDIQFDDGAKLAGEYIESKIRTEVAGNRASLVARHPSVRQTLLEVQRAFRQAPGLVADGRDMGTTVFADSTFKFYLTANAQERANRRLKQLNELGHDANIGALFRDIEARDFRDQNRSESPLVPAKDSTVIDTSGLSIKQVLTMVMKCLPNFEI